jgi:hypothetical protein
MADMRATGYAACQPLSSWFWAVADTSHLFYVQGSTIFLTQFHKSRLTPVLTSYYCTRCYTRSLALKEKSNETDISYQVLGMDLTDVRLRLSHLTISTASL